MKSSLIPCNRSATGLLFAVISPTFYLAAGSWLSGYPANADGRKIKLRHASMSVLLTP